MILIPQYRTARASSIWSPLRLFSGGKQGFWLDPSDLSTLWQNTAGTTPAAVGDPVARIDDKSGNGNNALQATEANRPILRQDADGAYYLEFDGSNDHLSVTCSQSQPSATMLAMQFNSGTTFYDGATAANRMAVYNSSNLFQLYGDTASNTVMPIKVGKKESIVVQWNGTSTSLRGRFGKKTSISFSATEAPSGFFVGAAYTGTFAANCRIYGIVQVSGALSASDEIALMQWARQNNLNASSLSKMVICDGNSLTWGTGATAGNAYPDQLQALFGASCECVNYGVASQTTNQMTSDAVAQIDPGLNGYQIPADLVAWEGTNDIWFTSSLATAQSRWNDYFSARQSAGWGTSGTRLVAGTVIPRGPFDATQDAIAADFNTWLRSNYLTYATHLVDFAADARLSDPTNATYFNADQVHLTDAGYAVVAELVHAVLTA